MNKITFLFLLCMISLNVDAQRVVVKRGASTSSSTARSSSSKKLAIGTDIGSYIIGYFPLSVEYCLADWFTVEGNVGLVTKNYIKGSTVFSDFGNYYTGDAGTGFGFGATARFFYSEEAFDDGYYLGLTFRRLGYKSTFSEDYFEPSGQNAIIVSGERTLSFMEFGIVWGKEWLPEDYIMLDSYYGFGFVNQKQYVTTNSQAYNDEFDGTNARELPLSFIFGFKLSFLPY